MWIENFLFQQAKVCDSCHGDLLFHSCFFFFFMYRCEQTENSWVSKAIGRLLWNRANCNYVPNKIDPWLRSLSSVFTFCFVLVGSCISRDLTMTLQGSQYDLHSRPFNEVSHLAATALIMSYCLLRPSFLSVSGQYLLSKLHHHNGNCICCFMATHKLMPGFFHGPAYA